MDDTLAQDYDKNSVLDMKKLVIEYMNFLGPGREETLQGLGIDLGGEGQVILLCRIPLPATVPGGYFVYKGLGEDYHLAHWRANESVAMQIAGRWVARKGNHEHAHIPEIYCGYLTFTPGEPQKRNIFICMEFVPGKTYINKYLENGCLGWSFRQKRRFVRQMALFRLSMLQTRGRYIGGVNRLNVGDTIASREIGTYRKKTPIPKVYYENLAPTLDEREWTQQSIKREMSFWRDSLEGGDFEKEACRFQEPEFAWEQDTWLDYLQTSHIAPAAKRRYREVEEELEKARPFCLNHGDMHRGFNVQMQSVGTEILAVIDWEKAMMVPYSIAVADLFDVTNKIGNAIGDPEELIGEDIPFELDKYWNHSIDLVTRLREWNARTRARRTRRALARGLKISRMSENNFAAYGDLTPEDLYYGDSLAAEADELEPEDDPDPFYFSGNRRYAYDYVDVVFEPGTWYYEPVLLLMDRYLQRFENVSKLCKWTDPYVSLWARDADRIINPI